jgi:hypothetical protein
MVEGKSDGKTISKKNDTVLSSWQRKERTQLKPTERGDPPHGIAIDREGRTVKTELCLSGCTTQVVLESDA